MLSENIQTVFVKESNREVERRDRVSIDNGNGLDT